MRELDACLRPDESLVTSVRLCWNGGRGGTRDVTSNLPDARERHKKYSTRADRSANFQFNCRPGGSALFAGGLRLSIMLISEGHGPLPPAAGSAMAPHSPDSSECSTSLEYSSLHQSSQVSQSDVGRPPVKYFNGTRDTQRPMCERQGRCATCCAAEMHET